MGEFPSLVWEVLGYNIPKIQMLHICRALRFKILSKKPLRKMRSGSIPERITLQWLLYFEKYVVCQFAGDADGVELLT